MYRNVDQMEFEVMFLFITLRLYLKIGKILLDVT